MEHNTWTHSIWKIWSKKKKRKKKVGIGDSIKYVNSSWNMLVNKTHNIFTYVNLTRGEPKLEGMFNCITWWYCERINVFWIPFWKINSSFDVFKTLKTSIYPVTESDMYLNCKGNHNETEVTTYNTITRIYADTQAPHTLFKSSQSTIPFTLTQDNSTVQLGQYKCHRQWQRLILPYIL